VHSARLCIDPVSMIRKPPAGSKMMGRI